MKITNPDAVHEIGLTFGGNVVTWHCRCMVVLTEGRWRVTGRREVTNVRMAEHEWFLHSLEAA